jgi:hypothetical protein
MSLVQQAELRELADVVRHRRSCVRVTTAKIGSSSTASSRITQRIDQAEWGQASPTSGD